MSLISCVIVEKQNLWSGSACDIEVRKAFGFMDFMVWMKRQDILVL